MHFISGKNVFSFQTLADKLLHKKTGLHSKMSKACKGYDLSIGPKQHPGPDCILMTA